MDYYLYLIIFLIILAMWLIFSMYKEKDKNPFK
ncbi:hypothetical protein SFB21_2672 [Acinetobacter bouvetii]|uniref:Uncharacterized protein n=1 Tax=Acinetobacter bouvetii TaxID=202951 RepID=A0A811GEI9_9GAMM|nr:hypothetical protein SFB21_2672 [Acinetobacter bouvetii]